MAGFSGLSAYATAIAAGKTRTINWYKNNLVTAVPGEWHCWARAAGYPTADALYTVPTSLHFQSVSTEAQDATLFTGGLPNGGMVGADGDGFKFIVGATAQYNVAATPVGVNLMLVDLLGFARVAFGAGAQTIIDNETNWTAVAGTDVCTNVTVGLTMLNGTRVRLGSSGTLPAPLANNVDYWTIFQSATTYKLATTYANALAGTAIDITDAGTGTHTLQVKLPRYTDGDGVQAFAWNETSATSLGAATPNLSLSSYTRYGDNPGTGGRATPTVLPVGKSAALASNILYTGATAAGKYGPFYPLQAQDRGIVSLETVTNSASYLSGEYAVALCKPIITVPVAVGLAPTTRSFIHHMPMLERVYDGACLIWLAQHSTGVASGQPFQGEVTYAWT